MIVIMPHTRQELVYMIAQAAPTVFRRIRSLIIVINILLTPVSSQSNVIFKSH